MAKKFKFKIYTSDGKVLQDEIDLLNVVTTTGAIGILANHLPLIGIIDISQFNYKKDGGTFYFAISGGVLNIKKDGVTILAESFEQDTEIDFARAEEAKNRAEDRLKNHQLDIDIKRAEIALKKSLNRLSLRK